MKRDFFIDILKGDNSNKGLSMVEIMISMGILAGVAYMGIGGVSNLNKTMKDTTIKSAKSDVIGGLFSRFGNDAKKLQIDHSDSSANEILEDLEEYPMAWESDGRMGTIDECVKCKGRYAIVVKPYTNYRGLFEMTVRIKHPTIEKGEGHIEITKLIGNF